MAERVYVQENMLLPNIRMARMYDTEQLQIHGKTKLRTAEFYELSLFIKDGGTVIQNGESHEIKAGALRFLRPGERICSVPPYRCLTVFFSFENAESVENELLNSIPGFSYDKERLDPLMRQLIDCFSQRGTGSAALANGLMLQLLAQAAGSGNHEERYGKTTRRCVEYLSANLSKKVTLEDLGRETGYSALHTLRLFRQDTGMTPHEYLSMLRMNHARMLLADTAKPMKEISELCGYAAPEYFQVAFRKETGITPGEYRRRAKII